MQRGSALQTASLRVLSGFSALALAPMSPAAPPPPPGPEPMLQDHLAAAPLPPTGMASAIDPAAGTPPAAYAYPYAAQGYAPAAMPMPMPPQAYAPVPYPMPYPVMQAAMDAARLRLRPILMTAFAFILGVAPLVGATGAGGASRQSLGTTVFGGMLAATILGLVFTPVFYVSIERLREGRGRDARRAPAAAAQPAE